MIIGIDPGKSGALCAMTPEAKIELLVPLPMINNSLHITYLARFLELEGDNDLVVIERPFYMPGKKGVAEQFQLYGEIRGICGANKMSFVTVRPQDWKAVVFKGLDWKNKKTKAGSPIKSKVALQYVQQRFPNETLLPTTKCKEPSLDMAEAVCIALYGLTIRRPSNE